MSAAKTKVTESDAYKEMLDLLTPEEREQLARLTGQDQGGSGRKTPVLKINYTERPDANGKKVVKGNFVLGQKGGLQEGKQVLIDAGTDLGATLDAVILKSGTQYSYWNADKKKCCSSNISTERGEVQTGSTLKFACSSGECPRRKADVDKAERCANQHVLFLRLPAGTKLPDGTDCPVAMFYVKGNSYNPFKDYKNDELKGIPSIAVTTKLATTEEWKGATQFFELSFTKGAPVPKEVFKENFDLVAGINNQLLEYKATHAARLIEDKPVAAQADPTTIVVDSDQISW